MCFSRVRHLLKLVRGCSETPKFAAVPNYSSLVVTSQKPLCCSRRRGAPLNGAAGAVATDPMFLRGAVQHNYSRRSISIRPWLPCCTTAYKGAVNACLVYPIEVHAGDIIALRHLTTVSPSGLHLKEILP